MTDQALLESRSRHDPAFLNKECRETELDSHKEARFRDFLNIPDEWQESSEIAFSNEALMSHNMCLPNSITQASHEAMVD